MLIESNKMRKQKGFSLLELLVTLTVLGAAITFTVRATMQDSVKRKEVQNTATKIRDEIVMLRDKAISMNTSSRMVISSSSGVYTMTTYTSPTPTTTCNGSETWTTVFTQTVDIVSSYQITGTALSNLCFYRDGSSSGGAIIISPIVAAVGDKTTTIDIMTATGFLDVTTN
jgi:prepilin-type N-terminal cleavage/methylation domain-containing protein